MEDASLEKSHRIIQSHVLRASRELHFDYFKMGYETRRSKKNTLGVRTPLERVIGRSNAMKKNPADTLGVRTPLERGIWRSNAKKKI